MQRALRLEPDPLRTTPKWPSSSRDHVGWLATHTARAGYLVPADDPPREVSEQSAGRSLRARAVEVREQVRAELDVVGDAAQLLGGGVDVVVGQ